MKKVVSAILISSCLCIVLFSCHSTEKIKVEPQLSSMDSTKIVEEIVGIMDQQASCWNMGDLNCFISYYADKEYSCIVGNQGLICGQQSIAQIYHQSYPREKMGQLTFSDLDVRPLSQKFTLVRGKYTLDNEDAFFQSGWYTLIFEKFEEGWRIISDQTG